MCIVNKLMLILIYIGFLRFRFVQRKFLRTYIVCSPQFLEEEIKHTKNVLKNLKYPYYIINLSLGIARKNATILVVPGCLNVRMFWSFQINGSLNDKGF